ncbi:mRNA binding Pumilio-homology domain protein, putative [Plasmodium gallinaceum]|uniref:mRNA binding Pumilio-homology domain protein, putative n=1 Tax=Plasmodium gallinaceum TaxID=5849 RepID=A0A1J1GND9_PLAGA|nr:mRNA binding Pumilio-homology domain protein, putative [Plasmodium gallinaceum]CRG93789.1 mRNA binding Pumilio-homology domain protein, putative [Plasmodium gallinaceum]
MKKNFVKRKNRKIEKFSDKNELSSRKKANYKKDDDIPKHKKKLKKIMKNKFNGDISKESKNKSNSKIKDDYLNEKCRKIMNDENLSKSKKKKMIKELKKKKVIENYDYYKKLRLYLNDLLKSKNKTEKKNKVDIIYSELKKVELIKFSRTNLGYHIISSLIINGEDEIQNKLWDIFYKHFNDICTFNFVSLIFQCFYKHGNEQIKNTIYIWLTKNTKTFLTKFASRLWHVVFKKLKAPMRIKIINYLIIPNINELKNISSEVLKKPTKEMLSIFTEENKKAVNKYLVEIIENIVEKELLYNIVSHNIILVACEVLSDEELTNLMEIIHEGCEYLISTNIGNKALIHLLGYSTNKHKKILIKILKNDVIELCKNSVNFLLIIRLLKITDDTKILNNFIVKKIVSDFENIFNDYYGFYVILEFFYDINEYNEDKYFFVEWKDMIYSKALKSVKSGQKRKTEIIKPIIEQLQILFQNKIKLNEYLKNKRYIIIIYEFLSYTENEEVLKNLLVLVEQIISSYKNKDNIDETYNIKNLNGLLLKLFSCTRNKNILCKVIDDCMFYEKLCNIFLLNIEIILRTELIKIFNSLIIYVKERNKKIYEEILSYTEKVNNKDIYYELKGIIPNLTHFDKYLELTNIDINGYKKKIN